MHAICQRTKFTSTELGRKDLIQTSWFLQDDNCTNLHENNWVADHDKAVF